MIMSEASRSRMWKFEILLLQKIALTIKYAPNSSYKNINSNDVAKMLYLAEDFQMIGR